MHAEKSKLRQDGNHFNCTISGVPYAYALNIRAATSKITGGGKQPMPNCTEPLRCHFQATGDSHSWQKQPACRHHLSNIGILLKANDGLNLIPAWQYLFDGWQVKTPGKYQSAARMGFIHPGN